MATTDLEAQITSIRNTASGVRGAFMEGKTSVLNDRTLSEQGKQEKIAYARQDANAQITELQNRELALIAEARQKVERKLAGTIGSTPDAVIAFRDAQDRADSISDAREATRILERALITGDTSLANAVAQRALSQGWSDAASIYTDAHPEVADALEDRAAIDRLTSDIRYVFARGAIYSTVA